MQFKTARRKEHLGSCKGNTSTNEWITSQQKHK